MLWIILIGSIFPTLLLANLDCSKYEYEKCIRVANPLVKEARLIFPDNLNDIDLVCRTWNQFVDCLKIYTEECFTHQQRRQFNKAVESPIESIHQMCIQPSYQSEYLKYAPCIKNTILQINHCGPQYNLLVNLVSQGSVISKSNLCCSYGRFKTCVLTETKKLCDRETTDGPAFRFAAHIIERALSFLYDQCSNYVSDSEDCNVIARDNVDDPLAVPSASSEVYPWTTLQGNTAPKEISARITPLPTSNTWFPGELQDSSSIQMLGSRTRPASYGRASSWGDLNKLGNTVQMQINPSSTMATRSDWSSSPTWNANDQSTKNSDETEPYSSPDIFQHEASSDSWYPAAGTQLNNEVDEPNQLGLRKIRNSASQQYINFFLIAIIVIFISYII